MSGPRVDFYVVDDASRDAVLGCACRLAEKAYRLGHRLCINAADDAETARLDELLWTFRDGGFLPHARADGDGTREPVVVTDGADPRSHRDLLINLAPMTPDWFDGYGRVDELVGGGEDGKRDGSARFRAWRERGVEQGTHKV